MELRRFRDKAGKEFAINCDLVQSWSRIRGGVYYRSFLDR